MQCCYSFRIITKNEIISHFLSISKISSLQMFTNHIKYIIYMLFGSSAGAGDVQRVKDRLLGKTKPEKTQSGGAETPALIMT